MARQDSGKLARFAAIFSTTRKMASEIENFGDVEEALGLGYIAFGAGGFFGERRCTVTGAETVVRGAPLWTACLPLSGSARWRG